MNPKAYVEYRTQHSRGSSSNRFGGPDMYVAVQVVPHGVQPLKCLNSKIAKQRGIIIIYCGEGYSKRQQTNKSMLGRAKQTAWEIANAINSI